MLTVIPVSHVDLDRAERLSIRIRHYNDTKDDICVLCSTWSASWDVGPILQVLRDAFSEVIHYKLVVENEMGWPEAANHLFYESAKEVARLNFGMPWYFMEADVTPLRPGWLDALKQEYEVGGKPYMGVINKSRWLNREGKQEIRGRHMVGTGVYPADFLERSKLIHEVDIIPWDVAIGAEVVPETHDTLLISHHWGCHKARRGEDGLIYCDSIDPTKEYNAGVILPDAVVVHGIKDGSIDKVLDESDLALTTAAV